jgi:hypothetical protein
MNDDQFPDGKIDEYDEGKCAMAVFHDQGNVIIQFPHTVKWIGFPPEMARVFAESVLHHAKEIEDAIQPEVG